LHGDFTVFLTVFIRVVSTIITSADYHICGCASRVWVNLIYKILFKKNEELPFGSSYAVLTDYLAFAEAMRALMVEVDQPASTTMATMASSSAYSSVVRPSSSFQRDSNMLFLFYHLARRLVSWTTGKNIA